MYQFKIDDDMKPIENYLLVTSHYSGDFIDYLRMEQGVDNLKKDCENGDIESMYYLGRLYMWGEGVEKNEELGDELINESIERGCKTAEIYKSLNEAH